MRYSDGTTATNGQYTGQYAYESLGLDYYVARFYDPTIGRFVQADTVVPGGVQGYDRYAYASNNPILYNDPSGHDPYGNCYDQGYCDSLGEAIQQITRRQTAAQALVTMFSSDKLPGVTPMARLSVVLNATSGGTPYTHFAIPFDDSGFRPSLRDGSLWPESSNQVGHFLTAADMARSSNEVTDPYFLRLITGHEMSSDKAPLANVQQAVRGFINPEASSLFLQGGDENFGKILLMGDVGGDRYGNSIQDLRLSRLGWEFGKETQNDTFKSTSQQVKWLQDFITAQ